MTVSLSGFIADRPLVEWKVREEREGGCRQHSFGNRTPRPLSSVRHSVTRVRLSRLAILSDNVNRTMHLFAFGPDERRTAESYVRFAPYTWVMPPPDDWHGLSGLILSSTARHVWAAPTDEIDFGHADTLRSLAAVRCWWFVRDRDPGRDVDLNLDIAAADPGTSEMDLSVLKLAALSQRIDGLRRMKHGSRVEIYVERLESAPNRLSLGRT
jgi:hypothetical protein